MVQRGGERVGAAAVALIHAHHVHASGERFLGCAAEILRIARTLKAVDRDHGERVAPGCDRARLPVAGAAHPNSGSNLNQPFFSRRKRDRAREQMAGNGLEVAVADAPTRTERFGRLPGLLRIHTLILNRNERLGFLEFTNAHL